MPCLLAIFALGAPRVVLVLVFLFSNYIQTAFDSMLWPLLGFFFLPLATLAYSWSFHTYGGLQDLGLIVVVIAVLIDLGVVGGSGRSRRRRL